MRYHSDIKWAAKHASMRKNNSMSSCSGAAGIKRSGYSSVLLVIRKTCAIEVEGVVVGELNGSI